MTRPMIGISGNTLIAQSELFSDLKITGTTQGFLDALLKADSLPFIFPIADPDLAGDYIRQVDGLLLTGGQDLSPSIYNEEPHQRLGAVFPERDRFEMALVHEAWRQNKPILGICRGMQLLNVVFGGSLYQDLSDFPSSIKHLQQAQPDTGTHSVVFSRTSWLSKIYGKEQRVNSYHHQGIKQLSQSFSAVGWSPDGLIEAIESIDTHKKIVAVQWHPEWMIEKRPEMQTLFEAFVQVVTDDRQRKHSSE